MKNTYIPLDVVWFDENKRVTFKKKLYPGDLTQITSPKKTKYILEVEADTFNGNIGDIMSFIEELFPPQIASN